MRGFWITVAHASLFSLGRSRAESSVFRNRRTSKSEDTHARHSPLRLEQWFHHDPCHDWPRRLGRDSCELRNLSKRDFGERGNLSQRQFPARAERTRKVANAGECECRPVWKAILTSRRWLRIRAATLFAAGEHS